MKISQTIFRRNRLTTWLFLFFAVAGNAGQIFAHGGEDHGDGKPKIETSGQGTISRVARLGDLEVMLKHPLLQPDTATQARLFVTKFETNAGFAEVAPAIEIESASGSVTEAKIEKTDTAGIFKVGFPTLPSGAYTIRAKLAHGGETDTTTFSGVEVAPASQAISTDGGETTWARTVLIGFVFAVVLALFGGLIYFVLRHGAAGGKSFKEETAATAA